MTNDLVRNSPICRAEDVIVRVACGIRVGPPIAKTSLYYDSMTPLQTVILQVMRYGPWGAVSTIGSGRIAPIKLVKDNYLFRQRYVKGDAAIVSLKTRKPLKLKLFPGTT